VLSNRCSSEQLTSCRRVWVPIGVLSVTAIVAYGAVVTTYPPPNAPFYAKIGPGPIAIHDGQWAAIPFYTSPECVPAGFNLLDFFDIPRAFGCPLNVKGFSIWQNGPPPIDPAPILQTFVGTGAVNIWFVRWAELQAGMADGVLTVAEIRAMPSLREGTASSYHEVLQPPPLARQVLDVIVAHGNLLDGTAFQFEVVAGEDYRTRSIRIAFR